MHYLAVAAALQAGSDQAFLQIGQAVNTPIPFASIIERAAQIMPQCFALAPAGFALFGGQRVTDERQLRQCLRIAGPQCCADFDRGGRVEPLRYPAMRPPGSCIQCKKIRMRTQDDFLTS